MAVYVALRKESVDRNRNPCCYQHRRRSVALRKESVDRNGNGDIANGIASGSLSARRAWIEIIVANPFIKGSPVALRKESVDRNRSMPVAYRDAIVALRKESVDRNAQVRRG